MKAPRLRSSTGSVLSYFSDPSVSGLSPSLISCDAGQGRGCGEWWWWVASVWARVSGCSGRCSWAVRLRCCPSSVPVLDRLSFRLSLSSTPSLLHPHSLSPLSPLPSPLSPLFSLLPSLPFPCAAAAMDRFLSSATPDERDALVEAMGELEVKEMRSMFNGLGQRCFMRCVHSFRSRALDGAEKACIGSCADKYMLHMQRMAARFAEENMPQQQGQPQTQ